ncbi:MAG: 50S ribosomal protein L11 methyltransferase, partial [Chloroflexota bacterium]
IDENLSFAVGSVQEIDSGIFPDSRAPVVIANILAHILIRLLDTGIGNLVSPNGVLLLSGILDEKEVDMNAALDTHGLKITQRLQKGDWIGLTAQSK